MAKVDLSKRGCVPAVNFDGRWGCSYGMNGMAATAHNYYTKRQSLIKVYDIYHNGVYECTFDTKKETMAYLEARDKEIEKKKQRTRLRQMT